MCVCVWLDWVGSGQAGALRAIKDFGKQYCLNFWGVRRDTADKRFSPRKTNIPVLWPNLTAAIPTTNGRGLSYIDRAKIAAIWSRCSLKGHNQLCEKWPDSAFHRFLLWLASGQPPEHLINLQAWTTTKQLLFYSFKYSRAFWQFLLSWWNDWNLVVIDENGWPWRTGHSANLNDLMSTSCILRLWHVSHNTH